MADVRFLKLTMVKHSRGLRCLIEIWRWDRLRHC